MNYYIDSMEMGQSNSHFWYLHASLKRGFWRVAGTGSFAASGYAVMDDFGNLVEVKRA